nr:MAG TPA: hypothetical protein [Caudoviricetes sp.]
MQIIEKNAGQKIDYELNGTKLSFADGALTLDLARRQRDNTVTLDIMVDSEGSLTTGRGLYYAAQVEIPPTEYDEKIIPAPEPGGQKGSEDENEPGGTGGNRETVERTPRPLNTDNVTLYLFAIDGIVIY